MYILNVSYPDIQQGKHPNSENTVLIQIVDPCVDFPVPMTNFDAIHQFEFSDVDDPEDQVWPFRMRKKQAKEIVKILQSALNHNQNVIVHCIAGVSRSGAVVEIGVEMGFEDMGEYRDPNLYMVETLAKALKKLEK